MRVHVFGWLGALVLVACGSEGDASGPGPSPDPDPTGEGVATSAPSAPPPSNDPLPDEPAAPPKLGAPYPVVLMHGMGGFGKLELGPVEITYFKGVVEDLAKNGEAVYVTLAPPYATSEVRAQAVAKQIDDILARTGKAKVNLVGHSQGGLDARVLASPNGLAYGDRIASVTTVATPHRGSKVADAALGILKYLPAGQVDELTNALLSLVQKTAYELQTDPAFREQLVLLSEKHMKDVFNPKYVDDPNVVYKSYAGRSNLRSGIFACDGSVYPNEPTKLDAVQVALFPTAVFLEEGKLKVNDGLVTVESAKWGTFEQCVPADHLKEVGQLGPSAASFDHVAMFRDIVLRVRQAGL
ncbi:MAG: alpha/beta fold hydrolase [Labilithrix sp.]|nr:alpha/beta fold hydrolase [Labilithrix sp.]MBX3224243.1 alpha/beta fold hydrolase [Labilithrix sp.]